MGDKDVRERSRSDEIRVFLKHLLTDVRALEQMLDGTASSPACAASAPSRSSSWSTATGAPAPLALEILKRLDDPHFTTELARFNLEFNLDPLHLRRRLPVADGAPDRGAARPGPRGGPRLRRRGRADGDPADPDQGRPRARLHDAQPALPGAQRGDDAAARRRLPVLPQGPRRDSPAPRLDHAGGLQHQLPGPLPGRAPRVRQALQLGPGRDRSGARGRGQLAAAVRQTAVVGDPGRALPAVGGHPADRRLTCASRCRG